MEATICPDRANLVLENVGLVHHVLGKMSTYLPPNLDYEDLVQSGLSGLIEAANSFKPDKEIKFSTYAYIRVRGAVIDILRSQGWGSRGGPKKVKLEDSYNRHAAHLGREPTMSEFALHLGVTDAELHSLLGEKSFTACISIDVLNKGTIDVDRRCTRENVDVVEQLDLKEREEYLRDAFGSLSDEERAVMILYYVDDLRLKEIAEVLEVTESRVSQIHRECVFKLRARMKKRFGSGWN